MKKYITISIFSVCLVIGWTFLMVTQPSNKRPWTEDQKILPYAEISGDQITIRNIRNFDYRSETDYEVDYYDRTFYLRDVQSVDFIVVPFKESRSAAHTFVSFGFRDSTYIAISIEIRKEISESYSIWKGMLRQYEIMYVVADENDVIKLRTNFRHDDVYLYPIDTPREKVREMFVNMLQRTNDLYENPEMYHTFFNSCTSNLVKHVNTIAPRQIPFSFQNYMPGYADEIAYNLGMIKTSLPWDEVRPHFKIDELAEQCGDCPDFSIRIRAVTVF